MATVAISYSAATTITIAPQNVATSATFIAGVESGEIDNTSNLYVDALVQGLWTVGTTPTINTAMQAYVWGSHTSLGTTAIDSLDGTSSAESITSAGILAGMLKLAAVAVVDATTSDRAYYIAPFSVAALFGGVLPSFWGLYIAHNSGVNTNTTAGNHVWKYTGVKYTVA